MPIPETRDDVLRLVASSALLGSLGIFAGSGMSKALTANEAPTWYELLPIVARALRLPDPYEAPEQLIGKSFPEIASRMVDALAERYQREEEFPDDSLDQLRERALKRIKLEVCRKTNIDADPTTIASVRTSLSIIKPAWVVTTNYDYLIEEAIGRTETLLPHQVLSIRRETVPVYHMHGHRLDPGSIVLTQEDYGKLFVELDYRHTRLSILFAESLTLMTGYSLGDTNVQTAVNMARNLENHSTELASDHQGKLVFLNWSREAGREPYVGRYGEIILDIASIDEFLDEVAVKCQELERNWRETEEAINREVNVGAFANVFISNPTYRRRVLERMVQLPNILNNDNAILAIKKALYDVNEKAHEPGGWDQYQNWLEIILDILDRWRLSQMSGPLFDYLASQLAQVAYYIEPRGRHIVGEAWGATDCWQRRKAVVLGREELKQALMQFADREKSRRLKDLLST